MGKYIPRSHFLSALLQFFNILFKCLYQGLVFLIFLVQLGVQTLLFLKSFFVFLLCNCAISIIFFINLSALFCSYDRIKKINNYWNA